MNQILPEVTEIDNMLDLEGQSLGQYRLRFNGVETEIFGANYTEALAQSLKIIQETRDPLPPATWQVCECGRVVDLGETCPDCDEVMA